MGRLQRYKEKKLTRIEKQEVQRQHLAAQQHGNGMYVYRNRMNTTLTLPKVSADGKRVVGPQEEWRGDDYFMFLVHPPIDEAVLVRMVEVQPETQPKQENQDMTEKLILDQPDKVTTEGTIETVVVPSRTTKPLNETSLAPKQKEVLLNDDASDGVEILLD